MDQTIENKILVKIKKARRGSLFFIEDFITYGRANTVQKALERLVEKSEIKRVARGIYSRPQQDPYIGEVPTTTEEIAFAIAQRDRARIIPTGEYALHALGLSTQMPMNVVYLTDGSARKIQVGKQTIVFKKTSPKNLNAIGKISGLAIQALRAIGKDQVNQDELAKIISLFQKEEPHRLEHDIRLAPEWIRETIRESLLKQT